MSDFQTTSVPMGGAGLAPKTFAPGALTAKLPSTPARRSGEALAGGSSLGHLVAQPYGERRRVTAEKLTKTPQPKALKEKPGALAVKTGALFRRTGSSGLDRKIGHLSAVDKAEKKLLGDAIEKRARNLPTGSKISATTRQYMKNDIKAAAREGEISAATKASFNKVIGKLT